MLLINKMRFITLIYLTFKGLEEELNLKFPTDLSTPEALKFLDDLCVKHNVICTPPRSVTRLLDKVS